MQTIKKERYIKRLISFPPEVSHELDLKVPNGEKSKFVSAATKQKLNESK